MKTFVVSCAALVCSALLPAGEASAQAPGRFKYCADFMNEAKTTKTLRILGKALSLDPDQGIKIQKSAIKTYQMIEYPGEGSYRIETNPDAKPTKGIVAGLQINDLGGDPREFEITDNHVENPMGEKGQPPKLHLFKYNFSFRNGLCLPTRVTRIEPDQEIAVFDFDECRETAPKKKISDQKNPALDCSLMPNFEKALKDKRFDHNPSEASQPSQAEKPGLVH